MRRGNRRQANPNDFPNSGKEVVQDMGEKNPGRKTTDLPQSGHDTAIDDDQQPVGSGADATTIPGAPLKEPMDPEDVARPKIRDGVEARILRKEAMSIRKIAPHLARRLMVVANDLSRKAASDNLTTADLPEVGQDDANDDSQDNLGHGKLQFFGTDAVKKSQTVEAGRKAGGERFIYDSPETRHYADQLVDAVTVLGEIEVALSVRGRKDLSTKLSQAADLTNQVVSGLMTDTHQQGKKGASPLSSRRSARKLRVAADVIDEGEIPPGTTEIWYDYHTKTIYTRDPGPLKNKPSVEYLKVQPGVTHYWVDDGEEIALGTPEEYKAHLAMWGWDSDDDEDIQPFDYNNPSGPWEGQGLASRNRKATETAWNNPEPKAQDPQQEAKPTKGTGGFASDSSKPLTEMTDAKDVETPSIREAYVLLNPNGKAVARERLKVLTASAREAVRRGKIKSLKGWKLVPASQFKKKGLRKASVVASASTWDLLKASFKSFGETGGNWNGGRFAAKIHDYGKTIELEAVAQDREGNPLSAGVVAMTLIHDSPEGRFATIEVNDTVMENRSTQQTLRPVHAGAFVKDWVKAVAGTARDLLNH